MILEMPGAQVWVARGGTEALDVVAAFQLTVMLLDIGMPGMDGCDMARAVRSGHPGHPVVIVALTGWGQDEDRRRSVEIDALHEPLALIGEAGCTRSALVWICRRADSAMHVKRSEAGRRVAREPRAR